MKKNFACLLFGLLLFSILGAQRYPVHHLTTRDGLPHAIVYRILQDSRGFLWFSTEGGLGRYDGTRMQNFDPGQDGGPRVVIHVSEDRQQRIWANVYNDGLHRLEGEAVLPDLAASGKWPRRPVKSVHVAGRTWCLEKVGELYCKAGGVIWRDTSLTSAPLFMDIVQDENGDLLAQTTEGLFVYSSGKGWQKRWLPDTLGPVTSMAVGKAGHLWIGTQQAVLQLGAESVLRRLPWRWENPPDHLAIDQNGKVWASNFASLFLAERDSFADVTSKLGRDRIEVNDLLLDHQGNLWLATYGEGVICVYSHHLQNYPAHPAQLRGPVNDLLQVGNATYFASMGMLSRFSEGHFEQVPSRYVRSKDYPYFIRPWGDKLLIGTPPGAFTLDLQAQARQQYIYMGGVTAALRDPDGEEWLGTYAGLYRREEGKFRSAAPALRRRRITDLVYWDAGLLIGTDSGLYHLRAGQLQALDLAGEEFVMTLYPDQQGRVWVGTRNKLLLWTPGGAGPPRRKLLHRFPPTRSVCEDRRGRIWLGTNAGLFCLGARDTSRLDASQGLISDQVRCLALDARGDLWIGASEGASHLHLQDLALDAVPDHIAITGIAYDSTVRAFPNDVHLSTRTRNIRVTFAGIRYPVNAHHRYRYRVQNLQEDWQMLQGQVLQFSSFPAGDYLLEIAPEGGAAVARLWVHVTAPFFETTWFRLCLLLLLMLLLLRLGWWWQTRRIRRTQTALQQRLRFVMLRTQALQAMVNPHFIFNSLNSVLGLVQADRKQEVKEYVTGFSRLLRTVLERSGEADISIAEEVDALRLYLALQEKRFGARLRWEVQCDPDIDLNLRIPNMLLQPFVENAVLHGIAPLPEGGQVRVELRWQGSRLAISILDDGVGMEKGVARAAEGKPMGIVLIRQRLRLLEEISGLPQQLEISAGPGDRGTAVRFVLTPLAQPAMETEVL